MTLPTASEINVYDTLDEREACKNYLGKSVEEVRQMLASGIGNYWEDLAWMGPNAFHFYLPIVIEAVRIAIDKSESDHLGEFLTLVECRIVLDSDSLLPCASELIDVCQEMAASLPRLDPEEVEMDNLPRRITEVVSKLDAMR